MASVRFRTRLDLLKAIVEMVFGWGGLDRREWRQFQDRCSRQSALPAWYPYLKPDRHRVWNRFGSEERARSAKALRRYFEAVVDAPTLDLNQLFFRAFEQQGANFLAELLPDFKRRIEAESWSEVISALASFFQTEHAEPRYDPKKSGSTRRSSFRGIKHVRFAKEFKASLRRYPPGGRSGWQLVWHMIRSSAALAQWDYDFGKALRDVGVLEFLEETDSVDPTGALRAWEIRRDSFSHFVGVLSGVGWNTFDYVLRDLCYPGCLFLFKVDSTNDALIQRIASPINRDRSKYLQVLSDSGILDRYHVAVVNMAIYAFCSSSSLGFLKRIAPSTVGYEFRYQ